MKRLNEMLEEVQIPMRCRTENCANTLLGGPFRSFCKSCVDRSRQARDRELREAELARLAATRRARLINAGVPERFHQLDPAAISECLPDESPFLAGRRAAQKSVILTVGNAAAVKLISGVDLGGTADSTFIWGQPGRGKTYLSYGLAIRAVGLGLRPWVVTPQEMLEQRRRRMDNPELEDSVAKASNADILIWEDIGMESLGSRGGDWGRQQMELVIDQRYQHGRPIIMTSNHPFGHLERLGQRAFSRLEEMVGSNIAEVKGPSYRTPRG